MFHQFQWEHWSGDMWSVWRLTIFVNSCSEVNSDVSCVLSLAYISQSAGKERVNS